MKYITFIFLIFSIFIGFQVSAQNIEILNSTTMEANEKMPDIKILRGEVSIKHGESTLNCDLAHWNTKSAQITAFGNVKVQTASGEEGEGDGVITSDTMFYESKSGVARFSGNVKLDNDQIKLTANKLDFNTRESTGQFSCGGTTISGKDTITSSSGFFSKHKNELIFRNDVVVHDPDFTIYSDSLKHDTEKKITYFLGNTQIVNDSGLVYCSGGWFNHKTEVSQFTDNVFMQTKDMTIKADSLYYEKKTGFGRANNNVELIDTIQKVVLMGNFAKFSSKTNTSLITNRAQLIQISQGDSLFLHSDTLRTYMDSTTENKKTVYHRMIKAYYKVKFYKSDIQAKCDSFVYSMKDSLIRMYHEPILWSNENQLTADTIKIQMQNKKVDKLYLENSAFIISQTDTARYDQIKGKNMIAFVKDNKLQKVEVKDNCESIYFAKDLETLIGVNKIESAKMTIYLENNKASKVWFHSQPKGGMYPPFHFPLEELKLKNFKWFSNFRPMKREDIFVWQSVK